MVTENKLDMGEFRVYRFGEHPKPKSISLKKHSREGSKLETFAGIVHGKTV